MTIQMTIHDKTVRQLAAGLGIATALFGVMPLLAPRQFARLFGFPAPEEATASMIRSLGLRDTVMGMGLWSAAAHEGKYAPLASWLLARLLTDGGDTLAVALAVAHGARHPRFVGLGALALGAAIVDAGLWIAARRLR